MVEDNQFVEDKAEITKNGNSGSRKLWQGLQDLAPVLKQLTRLGNFSFILLPRSMHVYPVGFWLRRKDLYDMLQALPNCCRNLELDTWGKDRKTPGPGGHICRSVQRLLPHLHHLRLRLAYPCAASLGEKPQVMKSAEFPSLLLTYRHHLFRRPLSILSGDHTSKVLYCVVNTTTNLMVRWYKSQRLVTP